MIRKFLKYYRPHWKLFVLDMIAALMIACIDLIFPMLSREYVNELIPNKEINLMVIFAIGLLILYAIKAGCNYFVGYWGHVMGARIEYDMRNELFDKYQQLEFSFFDDKKTGHLMNRLTGDLNEITELAHHGPEDLFISIVMLGGSFILLMGINVPLTLIIFSFVLLVIIFSLMRRKSMRKTFHAVRKEQADVLSQIESSLGGIRVSKAFSNEDHEMEKFQDCNYRHLDAKNKSFNEIGKFMSGNGFMIDLMSLAAIFFGGLFVYNGQINYGDLTAYILYIAYFTMPIRRLIQFTQQYAKGMAGFERFENVLSVEPQIIDHEDAIEVDQMRGDISFEDVTFRYENETKDILQHFNLQISKGKTIALVGPSGVGKTTISQLIPRFYDVNEGAIKIDGIDIRNMTMKSLRKEMGIVQQDVFMFYGTMRDNISYGSPNASDEEIIKAAKDANIHTFIMSLDKGYDTMVGERGVKLSGGQKQRIAISRVFLKNPPILILDEATSALDNQNERAIQESIERLSKDRTTLVIAHRLSTIKNADEIVVLADEGIIEKGRHTDLLNHDGEYKKLYMAQFKDLEEEWID